MDGSGLVSKPKKEKPELFNKDFQKEQSERYKYKHIHTGEYCTFEAYVAEYLILRRAERFKLPKPGYKFWTKGDPNHWMFMKQLGAARKLAKKYDEEAILSAIKSKDFDKLFFIGVNKKKGRGWLINPAAEQVIKKHQHIITERRAKESTETLEVKENAISRGASNNRGGSLIHKLRGK